MTDGINNRWWLDLVTEDKLPADILADFAARGVELPVRPGDEQILAQGKVDWLGCNYYHPERVQAPSRDVDEAGCPVFAEPYVWPEAKMNESRGWEIYPKGIYDFGMKLKNDYPGLEFFVSENGMGVEREWELRDPATGEIADDYRIEFVREHLAWIARAIACVVVGISSFVVMMPQAVTATLGNILVATNATDKLAESISVNVSDLSVKLADGYALMGVEASGVLSTSCTGTNGLFGAIIVGLLAVTLFIAATYGLTCAGIIAPCVVQIPWTTPAVISAFLTTGGDIRAAIWQVLEIVIAMAIYLPFMKVSERVQAKQAVLAEESAE